jgi:hypothetical protein
LPRGGIVNAKLKELPTSSVQQELRAKIECMKSIFILAFVLNVLTATVHGQMAATIPPVKIVGQKAIVQLAMTNNLAVSIESARATCFVLDQQDKMIGQSAKWVIGGSKDRPALLPKSGTTFNFVITSPQPLVTTNLTAKVSFSRVVLNGGKVADVKQAVTVTGP